MNKICHTETQYNYKDHPEEKNGDRLWKSKRNIEIINHKNEDHIIDRHK